jgi:hypothetical protein
MDKKEEEDSEQLLIDLFGTSDLSEMSIVPQSSNIDDDDDSDDEWLDQELEKIEKIRDMLLESTCYVFIMCNISLLLSPLSSLSASPFSKTQHYQYHLQISRSRSEAAS